MKKGTEYTEEKNYGEETARLIDAEIRAVVEQNYERVRSLLNTNRPLLDRLAARLEEKEVLSGDEVEEIINKDKGEQQ